MSKVMVVNNKQGTIRDFWRAVDFLGKVFPKRYPTWKISKSKTGDSEADSETDDGDLEERLVNTSGMDLNKFIPHSK